jgi:hypothetical protein
VLELGLAAHATRAVSTGTAEPELRPIDIPQSQHRDALNSCSDAPHRSSTPRSPTASEKWARSRSQFSGGTDKTRYRYVRGATPPAARPWSGWTGRCWWRERVREHLVDQTVEGKGELVFRDVPPLRARGSIETPSAEMRTAVPRRPRRAPSRLRHGHHGDLGPLHAGRRGPLVGWDGGGSPPGYLVTGCPEGEVGAGGHRRPDDASGEAAHSAHGPGAVR